ncbi:MAG: alkene reductase [Bacteroidetes bacterium]|nr:alkene reductase [Bacteroidota bacterium]
MNSVLATPVTLGSHTLQNRIIMAPLTRMRAGSELEPTALNADYYRQRATAGLIITEATQISQQGQGYPGTPGIYTAKQIEGWKKVTEAVHEQGGTIFLQLWHVGRISHSAIQPNKQLPVAPSALAAHGKVMLPDYSRVEFETPQALMIEGIKAIIKDYKDAAQNAKTAGFDGVEIHGANGYLIEQFLRTASNQRTDPYGGSIENRAKILFEILEAVLTIWPSGDTGIRLSPLGTANIAAEPDPYPLYDYVIKNLQQYNLAYLHIIESRESVAGTRPPEHETNLTVEDLSVKHFRTIYKNPIIAAGGFDKQKAEATIEKGYADAVAFGRHFISTPDLPYRLINGIPANPYDRSTFYGGSSKGYTDYLPSDTAEYAERKN